MWVLAPLPPTPLHLTILPPYPPLVMPYIYTPPPHPTPPLSTPPQLTYVPPPLPPPTPPPGQGHIPPPPVGVGVGWGDGARWEKHNCAVHVCICSYCKSVCMCMHALACMCYVPVLPQLAMGGGREGEEGSNEGTNGGPYHGGGQ